MTRGQARLGGDTVGYAQCTGRIGGGNPQVAANSSVEESVDPVHAH